MDGWIDDEERWADEWMMNRWMNGQMDGWMGGQMKDRTLSRWKSSEVV